MWLSTSKVVVQGLTMPFVGSWTLGLGVRWSVAIGSLLYSSGFMLTSVTAGLHFSLAIASLSLHGLGFSFVYATVIGAAQKWFPASRKGLVGSIVVSGYGFGSLIWVPFQTAYVNPQNLQATLDPRCNITKHDANLDCHNLYFNDPDLLSRIPSMFLVLGCIYAVCGFISLLLISEPDDEENLERVSVLSSSVKQRPCNYNTIQQEENDLSCHEIQTSLKPSEVLKTATFYQVDMNIFTSQVFTLKNTL